jgi:hypothetical protein
MLNYPLEFNLEIKLELDLTSKMLPSIAHASFKFLLSRINIDYSVENPKLPISILAISLTS